MGIWTYHISPKNTKLNTTTPEIPARSVYPRFWHFAGNDEIRILEKSHIFATEIFWDILDCILWGIIFIKQKKKEEVKKKFSEKEKQMIFFPEFWQENLQIGTITGFEKSKIYISNSKYGLR